ncbi:MAG: DNA recombination protein RmuC, partial [Spirochaetia bacterium]|nr:DNA recombination protein RmuC [Spirochaetia bacterium]
MDLNTLLLLAAVALLAVVFIKSIFGRQGNDSSAQLVDLKNQLTELRAKQQEAASEALNKQLEAEKKSLVEQQNLFRETQKANSLQMEGLIKIVNDNLAKTQNNLTQQLGQTQTTVIDVQKKLSHLQEATKNIMEVGKDISSLQNILQAPKLRGSLGEFLLEELLRQILPTDHFTMQYRFADDQRVDAVIQLNDGLIPVDSKFPLESFQ